MSEINLEGTKCQEANLFGIMVAGELVPCGKPGKMIVWHNRDGKHLYIMCEACGDHNVRNRGGIELTPKNEILSCKNCTCNHCGSPDPDVHSGNCPEAVYIDG